MPTLNAAAGDLSLVLPKRILDGIIEMIYALDKIAPGTANDDTLLYGVEVKFYSNKVVVNKDFETSVAGLRAIGYRVRFQSIRKHGLEKKPMEMTAFP